MKPSPFTYHRPASVDEALHVLAEVAPHGKVLAGGQSLLPILSMRLAAPAHLIDINWLTELDHVTVEPEGVRVGALARHRSVERNQAAAAVQPLLREALALVAHPTIRNRGTSVGSLAHADPSGELTAVLALTAGTVTLASLAGIRTVPAAGFFVGPLESVIRPDELATEARFPACPAGSGTAFVEASRRHGDYAMCGVAAAYPAGQGSGHDSTDGPAHATPGGRVAYLAMGPVPVVREVPGPAGDPRLAASWRLAAEEVVATLEPEGDLHASAAYRAELARVLTARALAQAATRAGRAA